MRLRFGKQFEKVSSLLEHSFGCGEVEQDPAIARNNLLSPDASQLLALGRRKLVFHDAGESGDVSTLLRRSRAHVLEDLLGLALEFSQLKRIVETKVLDGA